MVEPDLSVIIPTRNRCASLVRVLEALDGQDYAGVFEVVVVLNACEDDSAETLARLSPRFALNTVVLPVANAAVARNAGAAVARGRLLVFLDDDIDAEPGFLTAHAAIHEGRPRRVGVGYSKPEIPGTSFFDVRRRAWWEALFTEMARPDHRYGWRDLLSGNMSIPRDAFEAVGRFDESLSCREDYELGLRCIDAGLELAFVAAAVGRHRDESTLARAFVRARAEGEADAAIYRRRPELFSPNFRFVRGRPAWLRLAEGGLKAIGRDPEPAILSGGVRLLGLFERWRRRGAWLALFGRLLGYAYRQGVLRGLPAGTGAPTTPAPDAVPPRYDLAEGLEAVSRRLDQERPAAADLVHGAEVVRRLAVEPGAERLAGRHLTGLITPRLGALAISQAARAVLGPLPATPETRVIDLPQRETGVSVGELDVGDWTFSPPLAELTFPARLLVRRGQTFLGWAHLYPGEDLDPVLYWVREQVIHQLWQAIFREAAAEASPPAGALPSGGVSVVICTRDRLENLKRCLAAVERLDDPEHEVVVVDNASSDNTTRDYVRGLPWVRYVREDRPGLDWARNRGVAAARYPIVAFTDDDTQVDRHWLTGVRRAFAQDQVSAMTGLVAPMKLDTPARLYFEDVYGGMSKGFAPRWHRRAGQRDADLLWASACGVGANMAFRRAVFDEIGGFDPALDVGSPTRGGGDIEFFHRVVASGRTLLYEPSAMVWHEHRATWEGLRGQLRDNGSGFLGYLLTCGRLGSVSRASLRRFILVTWGRQWLLARLLRPGRHRRKLVLAEIMGALSGAGAYAKAQRRAAELQAEPSPQSLELENAHGA